MIFVRYENWRTYMKQYPVTVALLIANIAMFLVLVFNGGSENISTLIKYGAVIKGDPFTHETWRMFTAMFLHIGFEHLLFNMFALFVFAPPLERILGHFRYVVLFLLSGVLGNAMALWLSDFGTLSAGASGALYGLYGAYFYIALLQRKALDDASRKTVYVILAIGLIQSFLPQISWSAHIGGLVSGFMIYGFMRWVHRR